MLALAALPNAVALEVLKVPQDLLTLRGETITKQKNLANNRKQLLEEREALEKKKKELREKVELRPPSLSGSSVVPK